VPDVDEVVDVAWATDTVVEVGAAAAVVGVTGAVVAVGGATVTVGGTGVAVGVSPPQAYSPKRDNAMITRVNTIAFFCFTNFLLFLFAIPVHSFATIQAQAKLVNYNLESGTRPNRICAIMQRNE
jgi:hypothetical protein